MFFSFDNPWLWVALVTGAVILFADIYGGLSRSAFAKFFTYAAIPLHLILLLSLFVGGAELTVAVAAVMLSLLAYTAARYVGYEYEKKGEGER